MHDAMSNKDVHRNATEEEAAKTDPTRDHFVDVIHCDCPQSDSDYILKEWGRLPSSQLPQARVVVL
jgi:hypothetical protein